jgi:hypothetical protein
VRRAVEAENRLIVVHEVTMHGHDRDALSMMAVAARDAMAPDRIGAIADKGCCRGGEIPACKDAGIAVVVPKPQTSNAGAREQFDKADCARDAEADVHVRPAGEHLTCRVTGRRMAKPSGFTGRATVPTASSKTNTPMAGIAGANTRTR